MRLPNLALQLALRTALGITVAACAAAPTGAPGTRRASARLAMAPRVPPAQAAAWTYDVTLVGEELHVDARFTAAVTDDLAVGPKASRFVRALTRVDAVGQERPATARDLAACTQPTGCHVRYRFAIAEAARAEDDRDVAEVVGEGAYEAPPSAWLLRPARYAPGTTYALSLHAPEGRALLTGLRAQGDVAHLDDSPYGAVGAFRVRRVAVAGGEVDVAIAPARFAMTDDAIAAWVQEAAAFVGDYLGGFPVARTLVVVAPARGRGVNGTTMGGGGASILAELGTGTSASAARADWVLTHELVHVATPAVGWPHRWMEEGLATYLEPVVRARGGRVSPEKLWRELAAGVEQGLPQLGDEGLDRTHTWGRTYWGGALFWLLADVGVREASGNARSLDDVLRAFARAGITGETRVEVERVIAVGDAAAGAPILRRLYAELAARPGTTDLAALFARLGVHLHGAELELDDAAPAAAIRRAITHGPPRRGT